MRVIFLLLVMLLSSCVDTDLPPYQIIAYGMRNKGHVINKGDEFVLNLDVEVIRPVRNVKFEVYLPNEVYAKKVTISTQARRKYAGEIGKYFVDEIRMPGEKERLITWTGDVEPDADPNKSTINFLNKIHDFIYGVTINEKIKSMSLTIVSKKEGREWSAPIKGIVELDYYPTSEEREGLYRQVNEGHYSKQYEFTYKNFVDAKNQ